MAQNYTQNRGTMAPCLNNNLLDTQNDNLDHLDRRMTLSEN